MKDWIRKMMVGRYGVDRFALAIVTVSVLVSLLGQMLEFLLLSALAMILAVWAAYRMLSKNIDQRKKEERIFMAYANNIRSFFTGSIRSLQDSKTHHHYKCPECSQKIRVPKGRGKIAITCPKCHTEFVKKS